LKIAHVSRNILLPAGTERTILESSQEMVRQGVEVKIFTPRYREDLFDGIGRDLDIEEVRFPSPPLFDLYYDLILVKHLVSIASKWADVVILHDGHPMASSLMRKYSIPCIPFFHNDKWDWSLFGSLRLVAPFYTRALNAIELKSLRECPLIFANSQSLMNTIHQHEPNARIVPITIGVDTDRFHPDWGKDDGFIMMAGRFHPVNNFELGIHAVSDTTYTLVIAGIIEERYLWYYRRLKKIVSDSRDLRDRVLFKTLTDKALIEAYRRCSIFLSPRIFEYLGHAALEPMACGKPVIASRTHTPLEDDPPVLVCPNNQTRWREVVSDLMGNPVARTDIGRKSFEFVEQKHSLRIMVKQMLQSIPPLLESRTLRNLKPASNQTVSVLN
jgi:glycosyltransferase involved in cell wall biosynthesis